MTKPKYTTALEELTSEIKDIKENHLSSMKEEIASIKGRLSLVVLLVAGIIVERIFG